MDCSVGLVEIFKWAERVWVAADNDWKTLGPRPDPLGSLFVLSSVGAKARAVAHALQG